MSGGAQHRPLATVVPQAYARQTWNRFSNWRAVQDAVQSIGPSIKPKEIAMAFHALKNMKERPQSEFLNKLASLAIKEVHRMVPRDLAEVLHACAKMGWVDAEVLTAWQKELNDAQILEACTDLEISSIVYSLGKINQQRHKSSGSFGGFNREFLARLGQEAIHAERMESYSSVMLTNILFGLALLGHKDNKVANRLLEQLTKPESLGEMNEQQLSCTLYSMALLGCHGWRALAPLVSTVEQKGPLISSHGLSNVIYSLGKLRFDDKELVTRVLARRLGESGLETFSEQDVSNILHGLANMAIRDTHILEILCKDLQRKGRLAEFTEQGLSTVAFGLSQLKYHHGPTVRAIGAETARRAQSLGDRGLAMLLHSLGSLQFDDHAIVEDLMAEAALAKRVVRYKGQELAGLVRAMGSLRFEDDAIWATLLNECTSPKRLRRLSHQDLAGVLLGCAHAKYREEEYLQPLAHAVLQPGRLQEFGDYGLSIVLFAMCRLHFYHPGLAGAMAEELSRDQRLASVKDYTYADCLWVMANAELKGHRQLGRLVRRLASQQALGNLSGMHLARVLRGLIMMDHRDMPFFKRVKMFLLTDVDEQANGRMLDGDLVDMARSFNRVGLLDEELGIRLKYEPRAQRRPRRTSTDDGDLSTRDAAEEAVDDRMVDDPQSISDEDETSFEEGSPAEDLDEPSEIQVLMREVLESGDAGASRSEVSNPQS
eukprot:evm.model.scf_1.19 EVM.evm.TU.scf_1.19   scf_1:341967-344278(-)